VEHCCTGVVFDSVDELRVRGEKKTEKQEKKIIEKT